MKRIVIIAGIVAAGPALAQVAALDTDGDGLASYEEMAAAYPDMTPEAFASVDTSADGVVDDAEMAAAQEAGVIPATEG